MATTITTYGSADFPGHYANGCHGDRCKNGTMWTMLGDRVAGRLEFWFSTNNGTSWSEFTSARITNVSIATGHSMRIHTAPTGEERLFAIYRQSSDDRLVVVNGVFSNEARTAFNWHSQSPRVVHPDHWLANGTDVSRPDLDAHRVTDNWIICCVWGQQGVDDAARVGLGRVRYASGIAWSGEVQQLHKRANMGTFPRPSVSMRHLGDDYLQDESKPTAYVSWAQGLDTDNDDRAYRNSCALEGFDFSPQGQERLADDGAATGLIASCYTGVRHATVQVPSSDTDEVLLHLATPDQTSAPTTISAPQLGLGEITSLSVTWNGDNNDIYVFACGTTNQRPHYIKYDWGLRDWEEGGWNEINTDTVWTDTLNAFPATKKSRIDINYLTTSGGTSTFRHQFVGNTNVAPDQATWVTKDGNYAPTVELPLDWDHHDRDDDPQVQYELRRKINAGAYNWWNGTGFQGSLAQPSSANTVVNLAATWGTSGDVHEYTVRTNDGTAWGPWSEPLYVTLATAVNPTITNPTASEVRTSPDIPIVWTVSDQSAYRVELLISGNVVYDSGWIGSGATRDYDPTLDQLNPYVWVDDTSYTYRLTTKSSMGLESTQQTRAFSTNFTPPPLPVVTVTPVTAEGALDVEIDNGTAGGGEEAAASNTIVATIPAEPAVAEFVVATDVGIDTTYRWRRPRSGVTYDIEVVAFTAGGASRRSDS